jgi:hypothetical protein
VTTLDVSYGSRLCENSISIGPNAVRTANFCVYSFSARPQASKIMVRFTAQSFHTAWVMGCRRGDIRSTTGVPHIS